MLISELGIRGFKSYGNNETILKINTEKGELILLVGNNGAGKCVDGSNTIIDISIDDLELSPELINWLEKTDLGNRIFLYIKENRKILYEKIKRYRKNKL